MRPVKPVELSWRYQWFDNVRRGVLTIVTKKTMYYGLKSKSVFMMWWLVLLGVVSSTGETCTKPTIVPSYYTTSDAVIASETVFIVEISLTCANGAQNVALYADVNGKQFPVTRGQDVGRYQVSWSMEHKNARQGTYEVKFFDEESYSVLRKAQRNNEDVSTISPLFTVAVDHRGAWNGPWVSTEVLAAAIGTLVYYLAFTIKNNIQT